MKKSLITVIIVAIILVVAVGISKNANFRTNSDSSIIIGVLEPLTGNAAYYGESSKKGIELAQDYLKKTYPQVAFEIYHEDNQFNPKVGIDAYNSLKTRYKLDAIITQTSPVAIAIEPLAAQDNIPQMAVSASADKYSTPNDLSFRTTSGTVLETNPMSDFIKKNYKNVAIIYMNNEIGVSNAQSLKKNLNSDSALNVPMYEAFAVDATDFRSTIAKMKAEKVDAVYIGGLATHISTFLKQMKELNMKVQVLSFRTGEDPTLIKNAGELAEGVIFTSAFDAQGTTKEVQAFTKAFQEKYNEVPDGYAAEAYEGLRFLGQAFAKCGKNNDCIKNYLMSLKNVPSLFGNISYDENGDIAYNFFLKTVKDGKFVKFEQ